MRKWIYVMTAAGWGLSMIYEAYFVPEYMSIYVLLFAVGLIICAVGFLRESYKERKRKSGSKKHIERERNESMTPAVYYAASVLVALLLGFAVYQSRNLDPPHVMLLPMYFVLIAACIFSGIMLDKQMKAEEARKKEAIRKERELERAQRAERAEKEKTQTDSKI